MEHDRGYDFITNKNYGNGPKEQVHYSNGYPQPRKTPWDEIEHSHTINGRSVSTPALPSAAAAVQKSDQPVAVGSTRSRSRDPDDAGSQRSQASQRSRASQRSQTLSEAGGRAMS